jgi:hypothetical protein
MKKKKYEQQKTEELQDKFKYNDSHKSYEEIHRIKEEFQSITFLLKIKMVSV